MQPHQQTAARPLHLPPGVRDAPPEQEKVDVLLLDDNSFDRKRLRRIARQTGIAVEISEAASLIAFGKLLDQKQFHLAFIDLRLPEGDGLEALRMIRSHPENGRIVPILIASEVDASRVASAFKAGCADYLPKHELDTKRLRYIVLSALQKAATGDTTRE